MRLTLAALLLLTGCGMFQSAPVATVSCPSIVAYPQPFLDKAAQEQIGLSLAGTAPNTLQMVTDYGTLRAMVRACRG